MQQQQQSWKGKIAPGGGAGGKGAGAGAGAGFAPAKTQEQLSKLEETLSTKSWSLYENMLNLNVSQADVCKQWNDLNNLRTKILNIYGVPTKAVAKPMMAIGNGAARGAGGKGKGAAKGQAPAAKKSPGEPYSWKNVLVQLITRRVNRSITKAELTYDCAPANEADSNAGFYCRIFSPVGDVGILTQPYATEEASINKKVAEQAVARIAVQYDFPNDFDACVKQENAAISAGFGIAGMSQTQAPNAGAVPATQGAKRARAETLTQNAMDPSSVDGKNRVQHVAQLLLGRSVTKADIAWEYMETDGGHVATVAIIGYDATQYTSEVRASKKEAETQAAESLVESLRVFWEPLEEQRIVKKAEAARQKRQKKEEADAAATPMI